MREHKSIEWTSIAPMFQSPVSEKSFLEAMKKLIRGGNRHQLDALLQDISLHRVQSASGETQKLSVAVSVMFDLVAHGWQLRFRKTKLEIAPPLPIIGAPALDKKRVQSGHLLERDLQLCEPLTRKFIREMERGRLVNGQWKSVFSLMRDGRELAASLEAVRLIDHPKRLGALKKVIRPYLQIIHGNAVCKYTGFRLYDVWRYFRHTWTTRYNSIPGRNVWILVRDSAVADHPVIGIAALGSSVVKLKPRDYWIGWSGEVFLNTLSNNPTPAWARWLVESLSAQLGSIYIDDFLRENLITAEDLRRPSNKILQELRKESIRARKAHTLYAKSAKQKLAAADPSATDWPQYAETYLFRSKRATALASLLRAKRQMVACGFDRPTRKDLKTLLESSSGRAAILTVLRHVRATHVGVNMLDIQVCGAIAPYGSLLGGKLVALLMASPELSIGYEARYRKRVSVIASGVSGRPVIRKPSLVLLGTTSLYSTNSSQYNRLRMPIASGPGEMHEIRYEMLGKTRGYGSFHFSGRTLKEMERLLRQHRDGRRINSIFGEGVNPKMRKVRAALDEVGLPSDLLLKHGSPRLVYAVALATNFRRVLIGQAKRPKYVLKRRYPRRVTQSIVEFWLERWLAARILNNDVLDQVRSHSSSYPVVHGGRVELPDVEEELSLFGD